MYTEWTNENVVIWERNQGTAMMRLHMKCWRPLFSFLFSEEDATGRSGGNKQTNRTYTQSSSHREVVSGLTFTFLLLVKWMWDQRVNQKRGKELLLEYLHMSHQTCLTFRLFGYEILCQLFSRSSSVTAIESYVRWSQYRKSPISCSQCIMPFDTEMHADWLEYIYTVFHWLAPQDDMELWTGSRVTKRRTFSLIPSNLCSRKIDCS